MVVSPTEVDLGFHRWLHAATSTPALREVEGTVRAGGPHDPGEPADGFVVEATSLNVTVFNLDRRGPTNLVVLSFFAGVGAAMFIGLAGRAAIAFVVDDPSPGEGGRAASLGFFCMFAAFTFLGGEYAWRGRTSLVAYRSPGSVSIEGDVLRIDAPGILTRPVELHRAWVQGAEEAPQGQTSATTFCPGLLGKTCVIRLRQPIGIPEARVQLELPRDLTPQPDPSKAVGAIALDVKARQEAVAVISRWAKEAAATTPDALPAPSTADHAQRNRRLIAYAALVVSLTSTSFTLPN